MKKIFLTTLVLTLLLAALAACGGDGRAPDPSGETFSAAVLEIDLDAKSLLVLADEGAGVRRSADRFTVGTAGAELLAADGSPAALEDLQLYDRVEITFGGEIAESYPAQITAGQVALLPKAPLTREDVLTLAQKEELDWTDFAPYESVEVGSGLYILSLRIDEEYHVMVGGVPGEKPWYIRLCRAGTETYIDLPAAGALVEGFLAGETAQAAGDYPAAIRVEGQVYLLGEAMPAEIDDSAVLGRTTSYTDGWPARDGETNFSRELDLPYARVEGGLALLYQNEWHFCETAPQPLEKYEY